MTTSTDIPRPRFARMYPKAAARADRRGASEHRRRLLQDLGGRVVEVGAGNGLNFAHYPATVTEVVAIEPEPTLRAVAQQAAAAAPVPVTRAQGHRRRPAARRRRDGRRGRQPRALQRPDQGLALAELHRVLRAGGELRFYEHVIARCQPKRAILQLADRSGLWPAIGGGCHPARDTGAAIEAAGFTIERCERFGFRASALEPSVPHILGIARRP